MSIKKLRDLFLHGYESTEGIVEKLSNWIPRFVLEDEDEWRMEWVTKTVRVGLCLEGEVHSWFVVVVAGWSESGDFSKEGIQLLFECLQKLGDLG